MKDKALKLLYKNHLKKNMILSTVSGILTTEPEMIDYFDKNVVSCDIITTKSYQLAPTLGHREPIICSPETASYGNFVGLRNPGLDNVLPQLRALKPNMHSLLNISLAANCVQDFISCIKRVEEIADIIELNFSCPHAQKGFGASIGLSAELTSEYVRKINDTFKNRDFLLIIKLTPNAQDIAMIAKTAVANGADGVALINTLGPFEYKDNASGQVIFNKDEGGKGGLSGRAVKQKALECIKAVRSAIGDEPVILGMGGVETYLDALNMLEAGSDSVGLGSVLSNIDFYDYEKYFKAIKLKKDVNSLIKDNSAKLAYRAHTVEDIEEIPDNCCLLTLSGSIDAHPGEFVFLWIPQVGEKPFSISTLSPLSFVIKRRGKFTNAICASKKGDIVYSRGPYGKALDIQKSDKALVISGGSGLAVVPFVAQYIAHSVKDIDMRIGLAGYEQESTFGSQMFKKLSKYGKVSYVYDNGKVGRVLQELTPRDVQGDVKAYIIGPMLMMKSAGDKLVSLKMNPQDIYISVESLTLCGIGMCGECVCSSKLPCKEGTFYKYSDVKF